MSYLSEDERAVLVAVRDSTPDPRDGTIDVDQVIEASGVEEAEVSRLLGEFESLGYVGRVYRTANRMAFIEGITSRGRAVLSS